MGGGPTVVGGTGWVAGVETSKSEDPWMLTSGRKNLSAALPTTNPFSLAHLRIVGFATTVINIYHLRAAS